MMQAQPSVANTNLITDLSESSGPVEKLKGQFFGPQVCFATINFVKSKGTTACSPNDLVSSANTHLCIQDATEQRKKLGDFTGPNTTGGFDEQGIGRQEDATIDNPNDSPRPKDRRREGTAQAQRMCQMHAYCMTRQYHMILHSENHKWPMRAVWLEHSQQRAVNRCS